MQNRFRSFYKIHLIFSLCLPTAGSKLAHSYPFKQRKNAGRDHLHPVAALSVLTTASGCVPGSLWLHPFSQPCRTFGKKILLFEAGLVPGQLGPLSLAETMDNELVIK